MDKAWHELIPPSFLHNLEYVKLTGFPADHEHLPLDFVQAMRNLEKFFISGSFYKQILPRFVGDAGSLEKLMYLELFNLPELCNLIEEEGSEPVSVFQHLEVLEVSKCKQLTRLMTSATARGLVNLTKIVIKNCEEMTEILSSNGGGEEGDEITFNRLKSLELQGLSCLTNFPSGNDTFSFPLLEVLEVSNCKRLTRLMTSATARGLVNLTEVVVKDCEEMTEILSSNRDDEEGDKIAFNRVKSLELQGLSCLTNFSSGNDTFSFPVLEVLEVSKCERLTRLMTSATARVLVNLTEIVIKDCEEMTEMVSSNGGGEEGDTIVFNQLKSLKLQGLSCLKHFSSGSDRFSFPFLEDMIITECPDMITFSKIDPGMSNLFAVQIVEIEDEDPWRWSSNFSINKPDSPSSTESNTNNICLGQVIRPVKRHSCYFDSSVAIDFSNPLEEALNLDVCGLILCSGFYVFFDFTHGGSDTMLSWKD